MEKHFRTVVELAKEGTTELLSSSEVYDDVISALRSQEIGLKATSDFITDMRKVPHRATPVTADIAIGALELYGKFGGSRRLHYFDSFHVATAKSTGLPLLTSDKFVIGNATKLGIKVLDVRKLR